jgi:hypothetical protein
VFCAFALRAYVFFVDGEALLHSFEKAIVAAEHITRVLALIGHRTDIFAQLMQVIKRLFVLLQLLLGEGPDDELLKRLQKIDLVGRFERDAKHGLARLSLDASVPSRGLRAMRFFLCFSTFFDFFLVFLLTCA